MRTEMPRMFRYATTCSKQIGATLLMFFAVMCFLCGRPASAQQDVGYVFGTVTDSTGAAVPNAKVTVTWQATGIQQSLVTNETGYYISQPVQVGQYSVSVAAEGFATTAIRNLTVDAAARVQADLVLRVGATSATVTVQSTPPIIDTTDAVIGNTIDSRAAQQLPVNGRSVLAL